MIPLSGKGVINQLSYVHDILRGWERYKKNLSPTPMVRDDGDSLKKKKERDSFTTSKNIRYFAKTTAT